MIFFPKGEEIFNGYYDIEIWYKSRIGYYKFEKVDKLFWIENRLFVYYYEKECPGLKVDSFSIPKIESMKYGTPGGMENFKLSNLSNKDFKLNKKIWRKICS